METKKKKKKRNKFEHVKPPEPKEDDKKLLAPTPANTSRWGWSGNKTKVDTSGASTVTITSRTKPRKSSPFTGSFLDSAAEGEEHEHETSGEESSVSTSDLPPPPQERERKDSGGEKTAVVSQSDTNLRVGGDKLVSVDLSIVDDSPKISDLPPEPEQKVAPLPEKPQVDSSIPPTTKQDAYSSKTKAASEPPKETPQRRKSVAPSSSPKVVAPPKVPPRGSFTAAHPSHFTPQPRHSVSTRASISNKNALPLLPSIKSDTSTASKSDYAHPVVSETSTTDQERPRVFDSAHASQSASLGEELTTTASDTSVVSKASSLADGKSDGGGEGTSTNSSFNSYPVKRRHKKHKPRPTNISRATLDFDDERALDSDLDRHRGSRLSISTADEIDKPDDELLSALSKNEDILYRRSVSDMRWEVEESMINDDDDFITDTYESSDEAGALLWERLGRIGPSTANIPSISVNERQISLSHLDPMPGGERQSLSTTGPEIPTSYQSIFKAAEDDNDSSDSDPVQTIFDLIDDAKLSKKRKKGSDAEKDSEAKKTSIRGKLWRRRLLVVVLLNFLMRYRNPFATFNEVVVPIGVSFALIYGMCVNSDLNAQSLEAKHVDNSRTETDPFKGFSTESIFTAFCSNSEYCRQGTHRHYYIVYSPSNNFTDDIMRRVKGLLKLEQDAGGHVLFPHSDKEEGVQSKLMGVKDANQVEIECQKRWKMSNDDNDEEEENKAQKHYLRYPMGVIFTFNRGIISGTQMKKIERDEDLPKELDFTIRSHYAEIANTIEGFPFTERKTKQGRGDYQVSAYLHTGLIGMQMAIDFAFAEKIVEKSVAEGDTHMQIGIQNPVFVSRESYLRRFVEEPQLKMFEYPTYRDKELKFKGWISIVMAILLCYVTCDICVAQAIVREQQMGSIELLKIHGMTTTMRWVAYLIITAILRLIPSLAIALMLHYSFAVPAVAEHSSPLFLWLCLWMHGCTITSFNYFIIMGIKKPEIAGLVVVTVSFLQFLLPLHWLYHDFLGRHLNWLLCYFLPHWNLANAIYYYLRYELYEEGLDWYDFPVLLDNDGSILIALPYSCCLFLYSSMMYLGLSIYMDHIIPRDYSPKESMLYCLEFMWRKAPSETSSTRPIPRSEKPTVYEPGPRDTNYGPRFRNVTLTEKKNKVTVLDNISLDIYEGEVTCIVGQTGSGKSDFLNMIAGTKVPSSGFVDVKGMKVHEYHDVTNRHVSLCPQKQLLIESLSVEDHLRMCCMIHGASYHKAKTQATFLLQMFGLSSMRRHNHKGLTISDTKKLLVAMALSKSPSILLLDNPVDQLDPESSFQFWKLLQELKPERSIIVTCTKLEEAELYGDRIAVLSKGKLVCYGTPSFIKLAFGIGGILSLKKAENAEPDVKEIAQLMQTELKGSRPKLLETKSQSLQSDTLHFILPHGKYYAGLIERLEDSMEQLKITKVVSAQPSLWALFYQMSHHHGIEQVLAKRETAQILKGTNDAPPGFEEISLSQLKMPTVPAPNRGVRNLLSVLVMKKIWYYRQKHNFMLVAYIPQIIMIAELIYFAYLFVNAEPELLAKTVSSRMYTNNYILFRSADNEQTRGAWEEAFRYVIAEEDKNVTVEVLGFEDNIEARDKNAHLGYYSSNSIHSAAIASHILMQAFLYIMSPNRTHPHSTTMLSHPFIQFKGFPPGSTQGNAGTIFGVFLSLILSLLSAPAIRMVLQEKNTRFKMIQRMTGAPSWIYWACHGIGDLILYVFIVQICFAIVYFFDSVSNSQFNFEEKAILWRIFMSWLCWAGIPYTYLVSQVVNAPEYGYGYYILLHLFLGIIPKIVTYQFLRLQITNFGLAIRYIMYLFPPYSITSASIHFFQNCGQNQWCDRIRDQWEVACIKYGNITESLRENDTIGTLDEQQLNYVQDKLKFSDSFRACCKHYCELAGSCLGHTTVKVTDLLLEGDQDATLPGLHEDLWALLLNGIGCWALVILVEKQVIQNIYSFFSFKLCGNLEKAVASRDAKTTDEPEDVKDEHQKVDYMVEVEGDVDSEVYLVQDVTKFYAYTKGLDHVYFSVPIHAITGLLGLPKSGKSTMLEMLTSQCAPSAGFIYKDNDLLDSKSRKHLMYRVGYCPQSSYLLQYLTGAQMMTVMGRLRGLTRTNCEQHVAWWLEEFGLKDVANIKCENYRKGQKRRLCCAMALIGDVDVTIFDEPTVFMDSSEQYLFWNVVKRLPANKRTVMFSSIDAEEIQRQSSKVLVIDSGVLVAVGQLTDIFKNNKQGMFLLIRYGFQAYRKYTNFQKKAKLDKLRDHIIQYLSPCALTDEQENLLIYHLKDNNMKLSRVYAVMEGAKVRFGSLLEHFQVSEPSLDDIVLQFHKSRNKKKQRSIMVADDKVNASESQKISTLASTGQ